MDSHADIARKAFEAAARGDYDTLGDLLDRDVTWHGGDEGADGACRSREDVLKFIRAAHERGAMGELVEVVEAGNKVVVVMRMRAATTDDDGLRANLATFRDRKVITMVHYPNPHDALAAARNSLG
jgi:ketosteroid isomerase-like protein